MKLVRDLREFPPELLGGAVTIGNFDGVHLGHARILQRLVDLAKAAGGKAVVFTFDPHPVRLLRPAAAPPPLTWPQRKAELLAKLGVDGMVAFPTNPALLSLQPEDFFEQLVVQQLGARAVVEGTNFFFGRNRAGNVQLLAKLCAKHNMELEVVPPQSFEGEIVSSSRVRELVREGNVGLAKKLLTEPYRIRGMVTHGAQRGAMLGFPTANLEAIDTLLPAHGVYAGRAYAEKKSWPAAINVGPNPTFAESHTKVEAHLLGYQGSLYGEPLEVDFRERLRDIRTFASHTELKQQLSQDVAATLRYANI